MKLTMTIVFQIIAWLCAVMVAYGMVRSDIAVLQKQQEQDERRLERIERKIDEIRDRLPLFGR